MAAPTSLRRGGAAARATPGQGHKHRGRKHTANGLLWIAPALILVVGLIYFSIGYTAYVATLDWNGFILSQPTSVGFDNFRAMFTDAVFWRSLQHTLIFFVVTFTVQTWLGFTFAAIMHSKIRLRGLYKVVVFVPTVLAPAAMAPIFRQIFEVRGQLNQLLTAIGLESWTNAWLADGRTAMGVVMLATIWQWTGLTFILFYAAMSQIDPEVLEAARVDGASNTRTLRSIVWPMCKGTTVALATLGLIGALKTFDWPFLITRGGPNRSTEFLGTYIYHTMMQEKRFGYAAAISVALLVLALTCGVIMSLRTQRSGRK